MAVMARLAQSRHLCGAQGSFTPRTPVFCIVPKNEICTDPVKSQGRAPSLSVTAVQNPEGHKENPRMNSQSDGARRSQHTAVLFEQGFSFSPCFRVIHGG